MTAPIVHEVCVVISPRCNPLQFDSRESEFYVVRKRMDHSELDSRKDVLKIQCHQRTCLIVSLCPRDQYVCPIFGTVEPLQLQTTFGRLQNLQIRRPIGIELERRIRPVLRCGPSVVVCYRRIINVDRSRLHLMRPQSERPLLRERDRFLCTGVMADHRPESDRLRGSVDLQSPDTGGQKTTGSKQR